MIMVSCVVYVDTKRGVAPAATTHEVYDFAIGRPAIAELVYFNLRRDRDRGTNPAFNKQLVLLL